MVPGYQVSDRLCCYTPLLVPLPEMFPPLIYLVNSSSSSDTQISDYILGNPWLTPSISLPTSFDPQIDHLFAFRTSSLLDGELSRTPIIFISLSLQCLAHHGPTINIY